MMTDLFSILAQTAAPTSQPAGDVPFFVKILQGGMLLPAAVFLLFFYFFVFRTKKKADNEKKALLNNVKKGDTIETIGGLIGSVVSADEETILLKVDETANVKMKFNRRAIHRVIVDEKK